MKNLAAIAALTVAVSGPWAGCASTPKAEPAPAVKRELAAAAIIHIRGLS